LTDTFKNIKQITGHRFLIYYVSSSVNFNDKYRETKYLELKAFDPILMLPLEHDIEFRLCVLHSNCLTIYCHFLQTDFWLFF
jgi:hypothetical protein